MKFRGLIFAVAVLAGLVGALYWSNHHKPAETVQASADVAPKILTLNDADISRVDIKKKSGPELVLAKENGNWQITSPEKLSADQSAVSGITSTLSSLSSERLVDPKPDNLAEYGLTDPSLEVDVTGKNNSEHKLLIGDDTPTSSGSYAKLADDPRVFTIASYTKSSIDKSLNDLRDKRLITAQADKISQLDLDANQQQIEFGRNKDQWQIVKPKPLRADNFAVDELVRNVTEAKMDSSSDDEKKSASAFASGKPVATVKLTTDSGTQELQVRKDKSKDDYYAKSSLVPGVYKVSSDLGKGLDKKLDDFRNKKLFDFGYVDPEKIEIHDAGKAYFLTKGGEDWWLGDGKKADSSTAESVLDKVRDLQATKFADSGFGAPVVDMTVTSNSGKRVEKVAISKSGNDYIAKRENEPALYVLDAKAVEDLQKATADLKPAPAASKSGK
jgi:hypothetical protein